MFLAGHIAELWIPDLATAFHSKSRATGIVPKNEIAIGFIRIQSDSVIVSQLCPIGARTGGRFYFLTKHWKIDDKQGFSASRND